MLLKLFSTPTIQLAAKVKERNTVALAAAAVTLEDTKSKL